MINQSEMGFRRKRTTRRVLVLIFLFILVSNLVESVIGALKTGRWTIILIQGTILLVLGFMIYRSWGKIRGLREEYRRQFEATQHNLKIRDAALFSLSWSREIYHNIPEDRKQLVKQSFVLIGLGLFVGYVQMQTVSIFSFLLTLVLVNANESGSPESSPHFQRGH